MRWKLVLVAVLFVAAPAGAVPGDLGDVRRDLREAQAELDAIAGDEQALARRYEALQARADEAAGRLIDAYLQETRLEAEAAGARALLDGRADAIYRAGPVAFVRVLLGSEGPSDFLAREQLIEHALSSDIEGAAAAVEMRDEATALRRQLERSRAELVALQAELSEIRAVMEIRLAQAASRVDLAAGELREVRRQQRELRDAAATEQRYLDLVAADGAFGELLSLLGPTGGRGCAIPSGLVPTGEIVQGEASFYGEEFAGNPTAIGHVFDPALFTAAHLTLPLPSFLHVRYGDRCATVLVNDRGPYVDGRVLDLSEGSAMYLGLPGVGQVHAEVLTPG